MTPPPRIRYFLALPAIGDEPSHTEVLEAPAVIPWVQGFAAARGETAILSEVRDGEAEDTRRVHILQIAERAGWFRFLYQQRGDDAVDTPAIAGDPA